MTIKRLIKLYAFCYGCIGALLCFAWYISALVGRFNLPDQWEIVEAWSVLHGLAMLATFQPGVTWEPAIIVTQMRIVIAKVVLCIAAINFLGWSFVFFVDARSLRGAGTLPIGLVLTSLLLLNTTYIAIHWAFRPDNIFSKQFLTFMSNPLGWTLGRMLSEKNSRSTNE